jgi:hypothetical protein
MFTEENNEELENVLLVTPRKTLLCPRTTARERRFAQVTPSITLLT